MMLNMMYIKRPRPIYCRSAERARKATISRSARQSARSMGIGQRDEFNSHAMHAAQRVSLQTAYCREPLEMPQSI